MQALLHGRLTQLLADDRHCVEARHKIFAISTASYAPARHTTPTVYYFLPPIFIIRRKLYLPPAGQLE